MFKMDIICGDETAIMNLPIKSGKAGCDTRSFFKAGLNSPRLVA